MKVVIIGSNGQLGMDISSELKNHQLVLATHNDIEIKNKKSVFSFLKDSKPDIVINTYAFHRVVECEKKPVTAFRVNALGVKYLALACLMILPVR